MRAEEGAGMKGEGADVDGVCVHPGECGDERWDRCLCGGGGGVHAEVGVSVGVKERAGVVPQTTMTSTKLK